MDDYPDNDDLDLHDEHPHSQYEDGSHDSYDEEPPLAVLTFSLNQISTPFDTSVNYTLESLIEVRDQINSYVRHYDQLSELLMTRYDLIDEANWPFGSKKHMFDNVHSGHMKIIEMVEDMAERGWEVEDMLEVQWEVSDVSDAEYNDALADFLAERSDVALSGSQMN
ncbi:MAG: hypothetical protein Q9174_007191 [Haloplaca sp. 1 TL-2023]